MGKKQNLNNLKNRVRNQAQLMTKQNLKHHVIQKIKNRTKSLDKQINTVEISRKKSNQNKRYMAIKQFEWTQFNQITQEKTFECPICLEIMIKPTLLECGHAYCGKCLEELMIYKLNCGVCRHVQSDPQFKNSQILEHLIQNFITKKSQNSFNYYVRLTDVQNWKKFRNVQKNQLSKGEFVDFRDKQLRWRKGQITKILYQEKNDSYLLELTYKKGQQILTEELSSKSTRIAKFSYYTKMKYLETVKYQSNIIQENEIEAIFHPLTQNFVNTNDQIDRFFFDGFNLTQNEELQSFNYENQTFMSNFLRPSHYQSLTDMLQNNREQIDGYFQILN